LKGEANETEDHYHRCGSSVGADYRIPKYGHSHISLLFLDNQHVPFSRDHRRFIYRISFGIVGWLSHKKTLNLEISHETD
jgi:hypothetical protein